MRERQRKREGKSLSPLLICSTEEEHTEMTGAHALTKKGLGWLWRLLLYVGAVPVDGVPVGGHLEQVRPGETR